MKFTPGPIGADFSGSIGSTTASRNRFGPYLRTKAIPINPNTARQQAVRSSFGALVTHWTSTLTQAERDGWNLWAENTTILGKDGNPINITGQNAFIRFNAVRLQIGRPRVEAAPIVFNNGAPVTGFEATQDSAPGVYELDLGSTALALTILFAAQTTGDGDVVHWLGNPVNTSRAFYKGPYQFAFSSIVADASTSEDLATLLSTFLNALPPVTAQFRSIRWRMVYNDGRLSEKFEALAVITNATV